MIKLIKSTFYQENVTKKKLAEFIIKSQYLSMGKECFRFEKNFAQKQKTEYAVFVNSGSSANLILIQALLNLGRLKKGDKVGVSALTWSTNVMPIMELGLEPVIIDCELDTLNVSPRILEKYLDKIQALFLTNALGFSDDILGIKKMCEENDILFLEDNCESLGTEVDGCLLGNFSLASTFSFFVGHHMSTIEGGMLCTNDEELYNMFLIARAHGWGRNLKADKKQELEKKHKIDNFYSQYTFYDLGFGLRPSEINGFLGNVQILFLDDIIAKREENFQKFLKATHKNKKIIPLEIKHMNFVSNFAMPVVFKEQIDVLSYRKKFSDQKVEIRPIIAGCIAEQPFFKKYINSKQDYPNASFIHKNGFYFGNNPDMTEQEINILCNLLYE